MIMQFFLFLYEGDPEGNGRLAVIYLKQLFISRDLFPLHK